MDGDVADLQGSHGLSAPATLVAAMVMPIRVAWKVIFPPIACCQAKGGSPN
jgi:hypothetical protein